MPTPGIAPDYKEVHKASGADDPATTSEAAGINAGGSEYINVQVVPDSGPAGASVYFWSDAAGAWIAHNPAIDIAPSPDPYEFEVLANGRKVLVALDAAGTVYASGFNRSV